MNIRNFTLAVLAAATLAGSSARAEEKPKAVVAVDVPWRLRPSGSYSWFAFGLEWEFPFAGMSGFINPSLENPVNGSPLNIGGDIGVRFYPLSAVPRVFYIGPYIGGTWINATRVSTSLGVQIEGRVGVLLGLSLLLGDMFLVSAGVGGEYYNIHELLQDGSFVQTNQNLGTVIRASVGFAF
ncbi:MAG TPA: hypothetical protein VIG99_11920 [Myxococcaceae bacterium]|jgi:hypothetical protein